MVLLCQTSAFERSTCIFVSFAYRISIVTITSQLPTFVSSDLHYTMNTTTAAFRLRISASDTITEAYTCKSVNDRRTYKLTASVALTEYTAYVRRLSVECNPSVVGE